MSVRNIIRIDEEKCDGCGLCVPACVEGALRIVDGKARLVSETYCDGLGACLGECPRGAISIEQRETEDFDSEAAAHHKAGPSLPSARTQPIPVAPPHHEYHSCPGSRPQMIAHDDLVLSNTSKPDGHHSVSQLSNWPVQLNLVPAKAPYYEKARLLIAADCVPFAFPEFHDKFLAGRTLLIGCPKLDDAEYYLGKLTEIFKENDLESIEVAYMEVPCCFGLVYLVQKAIENSGKEIPVKATKIGIHGEIIPSSK